MDAQPPPKPCLWNKSTFDVVTSTNNFFSFPENFPDDYQMLSSVSHTQLSTLIEVQLVRFFLEEKALREKRYDTLRIIYSRVYNLNKRTGYGEVVLKQMKVRREDMKVLVEGVVAHARVQQEEVKGLKKSLEETHNALEGMKEKVSQLTNDFMTEFVHHFEEARRQISLLYPIWI